MIYIGIRLYVRLKYKFKIYLNENLRNISKTNIYTNLNESENSYSRKDTCILTSICRAELRNHTL